MSLRTDDIEGARPKYFEKQKLIAKAQQYNSQSNIFSPQNINQQNIPMRNPDIYSSQMMNQAAQQMPQQSMQQIDNQPEQNPSQVQGREKSMYQIEYAGESPQILNNRSSVDYGRQYQRNPIYHYSAGQGQGSKMMSEKQYQEQLVLQEMKKFKDQQQIIEQEKRRRELEFREQELIKKQREQEQMRLMQQQQDEKLRIQRQEEEQRRILEREQQIKLQEEIRIRDQILKEKERMIIEQERQSQQQRKSANVNRENLNNNSAQYQPEQYANDLALINQINQQQSQISQARVPSSSQNPQNMSLQIQQQPDINYPEMRKTPIAQVPQDQQISQSPPANAKYFNTPLPSQYKKMDQEVIENQSQVYQQQQPSKLSQLAAKSILNPMQAILKHNNELPNYNVQQTRARQKPTRVLAIIDSDSKIRELINKFFNVRGIYEFEIFSLPGSAAGLINDKGWRDTFFSCFSFMRQQYDFTDIYVFTSIDSAMIPLWYEQSNSTGSLADKQILKNYHVENLKQSANVLSQNISQTIKISSFLFDNRGGSEKIV